MTKVNAQVIQKAMHNKHGITLDGLDDEIIDYLLNMDTESMSEEEVHDIIVAYIPALDSDTHLSSFKSILFECNESADKSCKLDDPVLNPVPISLPPPMPTVTPEEKVNVDNNVQELHTMMPHIDLDLIEFVYYDRCGRCKVEAGRFLVENSIANISQLKEAHEARLAQKEKEEQREKRKMKSIIFEKYGAEEVQPKYDEKGNTLKTVKPVIFIDTKKQAIRYRGGEVVSYKGEKVIIERNPADDYDGGSRGKVKTKGKRGPGWV